MAARSSTEGVGISFRQKLLPTRYIGVLGSTKKLTGPGGNIFMGILSVV